MAISERFTILLEILNENPNSMSKKLGVSQTAVSRIAAGEYEPSSKVLIPLLKQYPTINITWLLVGQGDMFLSETGTIEERLSNKDKIIKILEQSVSNLEQTVELQKKTLKEKDAIIQKLEKKEKTA